MNRFISITLCLFLFGINSYSQERVNSKDTATTVKKDSIKTNEEDNDFACYLPVGIEPEFPGGDAAWALFLGKHLTYPCSAIKKKIEGTVLLQFTVYANGTIHDIHVVSGPTALQRSAD